MSEAYSFSQAHLSAFRPSDRAALNRYLDDAATAPDAENAIKQFIVLWERAEWLEAYSIERIGKWIAKYRSPQMTARFQLWAKENPSEARNALLKGLELGTSQRELIAG